MKTYVLDTSVVIEKITSKLIKDKEISGTIIIPNAVMAELEAQANKRKEIGLIGIEEVQELQELKKGKNIEIRFAGLRPTPAQIKFAKAGEIDAMIRQIAYDESATLITADKVQSESAKAFGLNVRFIETHTPRGKLKIEKYFDDKTMSLHLKEDCIPKAKRGTPGNWKLVDIGKKKLGYKKIDELAKEIVEKTKVDPKSFIEISNPGSTIIQYKKYRIVIVRKPIADGLEITAIKPIKKLSLENYKLPDEILERIKTRARGMIIAGETGSGKSTLAQAIAEQYVKEGKITKTVESPRDLQLDKNITQYSKSFTSSGEIHDILFLSRPDNIIFDEIRDTPDFKLFTDLRLAGSNCIGVLHAAAPIDTVQRFVGRLDTGTIPSTIDTILFVEAGKVTTVYTLKMLVKVPTGMTESDLARPVIEITDYMTKKLMYELYSYGEETVIIPVQQERTPEQGLAEKQLERELKKYSDSIKVKLISSNRAILYAQKKDIPSIIGTKGRRIENIEKKVGIKLTVKEYEGTREELSYKIIETKKYIALSVPRDYANQTIEISLDKQFLFSGVADTKGRIKIHKKSQIGKTVLSALKQNKKFELELN
jgi:ATPase